MSQENLNAFIAKVQSDSSLQEQLKNVNDANEAIAIAKSAGFKITAGDLIRSQARLAAELSDEQLEAAAGGGLGTKIFVTTLFAWFTAPVVGALVYLGNSDLPANHSANPHSAADGPYG